MLDLAHRGQRTETDEVPVTGDGLADELLDPFQVDHDRGLDGLVAQAHHEVCPAREDASIGACLREETSRLSQRPGSLVREPVHRCSLWP